MTTAERGLLIAAAALSAGFVAIVCFRPTGTVDLWWTLQAGDHVLATGDVPRTALWTIDAVRDAPYVCHGWLAGAVMSAVAATLGLDAVPLVPTAIALAVLGSLVALGRQLGASWLGSLVVADLLLYTVALRMICRAEVFGYLAFALALNVLAAYVVRGRPRVLLWLVPITLVWANAHGSFLLLLAVLPLVAGELALEGWRRGGFRADRLAPALFSRETGWLAAATLGVALTSLANPYGLDLHRSLLEPSQSDSMTRFIAEWRPIYAGGSLPPRFLVPALALVAAFALGWKRLSFVALGLAALLTALAVSAERHITFFGIGAAWGLGEFAAGVRPGPRARTAVAAALVAALVAGNAYAAAVLGFDRRSLRENPSPWLSDAGREFVLANVRGNVLNAYHYGGLLIYFGYPEIRVAMDSRAGPYPPDYYRAYRRALYGNAPALRDFVDRYAIDHVVIGAELFERFVRRRMGALPDFGLVYQDAQTVVLSRTR